VKFRKHQTHGRALDERHVPIQHEYVTVETLERSLRLKHGMGGAELRFLCHHDGSGVRDCGLHLLAPRAHDDDGAFGRKSHMAGPRGRPRLERRKKGVDAVAMPCGAALVGRHNEHESRLHP